MTDQRSFVRRGAIRALSCLPLAIAFLLALPAPGRAEAAKTIALNAPDLKRGLPFMETLSVKASAREWSARELSLQDLSDLLWAANGINRPEEKKYTASSAMNAHDVAVYVFMNDGVYLYDADQHALNLVLEGDHRAEIMMAPPPRPADAGGSPTGKPGEAGGPPPERPGEAGGPPPERPGEAGGPPPGARPAPSDPPVQLVLVSDSTRFKRGAQEQRYEWGALDAGIVSQNISLFCAATGLKTRPRAAMDKGKIKILLALPDTSYVLLNHPVGYAK